MRPLQTYGNLILYTGNDPIFWAAFTARFSRSPLSAYELWDAEFSDYNGGEVFMNKVSSEASTNKTESRVSQKTKTEKFLDKIVSEYGDNSVMEMAWVPFLAQNTSILLSMLLTDPRFGWSPMERSTRRMKMYPVESTESLKQSWSNYNAVYEEEFERTKKEHPSWSTMAARDDTCDRIRHLVPLDAATLIGFTGNARSFAALYHNLVADRFNGVSHDHPIFAEMERLKKNMADMFIAHYAPFARKIDTAHDTYVHDTARVITLTSFECITPFYRESHVCTSLNLLEFPNNDSFFVQEYACDPLANVSSERINRHGVVPALFSTISVSMKIYSTVSIYREFKRHRMLDCMNLFIEDAHAHTQGANAADVDNSPREIELNLGTRAYWRATGTLEGLMRMIELRTEEKAHIDYRTLCDSILRRLKRSYANFAALEHVFHFTLNE